MQLQLLFLKTKACTKVMHVMNGSSTLKFARIQKEEGTTNSYSIAILELKTNVAVASKLLKMAISSSYRR